MQQEWWSLLHWGLRQGWAGGLWVLWFCRFVEISTGGGSTRQPRRTETCQCVSGQLRACHGALQRKMKVLQCSAGVVGPALAAAAQGWAGGLWVVRFCWFVKIFQRRRQQHSATTSHRALPVCEWPALSKPWGTVRSNAASAVCCSCGGACTGGCGRAGQVVGGGCGVAGLWRFPHRRRQHSATTAHRHLSVYERPTLGMPWGTAVSNAASAVCSSGGGACTGAAAGLGRWFVEVVVLPVCGDFHRSRQHSATTTAHRALPVCEWPAQGMPWGTARSNSASAVSSSCGGACTGGGCGRAGQVVCGGCGFADLR